MVRDRGSAVVSWERPAGFGVRPRRRARASGRITGTCSKPVGVSPPPAPLGAGTCPEAGNLTNKGVLREGGRGTARSWGRGRSEAGARLGSARGGLGWGRRRPRRARLSPASRFSGSVPRRRVVGLRGTRATKTDGRAELRGQPAAPRREGATARPPAKACRGQRAPFSGIPPLLVGPVTQRRANARPARGSGSRAVLAGPRGPPWEPGGVFPGKKRAGRARERRPLGPGSGRAPAGPSAACREPGHGDSLGSSSPAGHLSGGAGGGQREEAPARFQR